MYCTAQHYATTSSILALRYSTAMHNRATKRTELAVARPLGGISSTSGSLQSSPAAHGMMREEVLLVCWCCVPLLRGAFVPLFRVPLLGTVDCVCVCFLPIRSGHQVRWTYQPGSHRIFNPPSFCGACLDFCSEKDSAIPFPRRP